MFFGYSSRFYRTYHAEVEASARAVAPLILEMTRARSVVDVGCGQGTWLSVFRELGVERVQGMDGSYVDRAALRIPAECFRAVDLAHPPSGGAGAAAPGSFELAMSLEVAEHLPPETADAFVAFLTSLAPVVVLSAAVPGQGGTGHVNEQWPDYWVARFAARGFAVADAIRPRIWSDRRVAAWYRQNLLVFVRNERLAEYPALAEAAARTRIETLCVVHPELYAYAHRRPLGSVWSLAAWLPRLAAMRLAETFARVSR